MGSQPTIIRRALDTLGDIAGYTFIDIGCGKGRPLVVASEYPFARILGCDISAELVKTAKVGIINDGPQKPSSIHRHVGQRPTVAAGNTDGDLAMLQWTAASPYRTLELVVHHTDGEREYAYDRDPILGSGTGQILAAAAEHKWTVIDMAADWVTIHPDT